MGRDGRQMRRSGFTLIELLVVITIIGIIISLILVAAADGVRRAEERATQALIAKLETAMNDRLDAILNQTPPINQTHRYLAAITFNNGTAMVPVANGSVVNSTDRRAFVIAQSDLLRAEIPDVFFLNANTSDGGTVATSYPLNFAAAPYPPGTKAPENFVVPLGDGIPGLPYTATGYLTTSGGPERLPRTVPPSYLPPAQIGMFGASFSAAGSLYKNLGYQPTGYDGVDNNGNGFIDELAESQTDYATVSAKLANHTHKTARAEVLYALLVEGIGPLGSAFSRDEFTDREVRDTDNDGLPEFIDAWGEPLQFYRWPIFYGGAPGSSDSQKGSVPYGTFSDARQQDPLDPNQLLVAPAWWSRAANPGLATSLDGTQPQQATFAAPSTSAPNLASQGAIGFMNYFRVLVDANVNAGSAAGTNWDRGGSYNRRAYQHKFLILSGGPDRVPGVAEFNRDYTEFDGLSTDNVAMPDTSRTMEATALALIYIENQADQNVPGGRGGAFLELPNFNSAASVYLQTNSAADDISNHNVAAPSTGVR